VCGLKPHHVAMQSWLASLPPFHLPSDRHPVCLPLPVLAVMCTVSDEEGREQDAGIPRGSQDAVGVSCLGQGKRSCCTPMGFLQGQHERVQFPRAGTSQGFHDYTEGSRC
jgi:hypothetical protein